MRMADTHDLARDPCPLVILHDYGAGFAIGAVGGGIWHAVKGFRNSPHGQRLHGSVTAMKLRAPVLGGYFATWSGLYGLYGCAFRGLRGKEDMLNSPLAGLLTGASMAIRGGPRAALSNGLSCALVMVVIEGVGMGVHRLTQENMRLEWHSASGSES